MTVSISGHKNIVAELLSFSFHKPRQMSDMKYMWFPNFWSSGLLETKPSFHPTAEGPLPFHSSHHTWNNNFSLSSLKV